MIMRMDRRLARPGPGTRTLRMLGKGLFSFVLWAALTWLSGAAAAQDITAHFSRYDAHGTTKVDHSEWDRLLATYVVAGADKVNRVDYRRFKAQGYDRLRAYLATMQAVPVSGLSKPEQFAYWVNLYNAKTIDVVLAKYPVASIRDISPSMFSKGPWGQKVIAVEGVELSLDDIEHKILRPLWKDARVHYAVNCASLSCPNLARTAYVAARLDAMLVAAARDYVNHPRGVSVEGGKMRASSIYSWYGRDFGSNDAAILDHIRRYAAPNLARALAGVTRIADYDYDWRLNDTSGGS